MLFRTFKQTKIRITYNASARGEIKAKIDFYFSIREQNAEKRKSLPASVQVQNR